MSRKPVILMLLSLLCVCPGTLAQTREKLALLIRNIYGPNGLVVDSEDFLPDGSNHSAHFNSAFQSNFTQFNIALASQLAAVPIPSPAAGFTYTFDSSTGTFKRSTQSFGPILADRAETIGRKRYSLGFNYQAFTFDSLEGVDLFNVPAVFTHDDFQLGGGRADVVTTVNSIEATVGQFTAFLSYGLADKLDLALVVPIVRTRLNVVSDATIQRIGTAGNPRVHFFRNPAAPGTFGSQKRFFSSGTASGLGDLIVRLKGNVLEKGHTGLALGLDVRVPTGDERDLLGSGALGAKPFAALSFIYKRFSPHINLGYQWNGNSLLSGDVSTGRKEDLPDQLLYVAGIDIGIDDRFSFAFDFLGQRVINSPRLIPTAFTATAGATSATFPDIRFDRASFSEANGATGFKANLAGRLLLNFNLLFRMNKTGLRDKVTPLFGIEYSFQ